MAIHTGTTAGSMWIRKALKSSPAALPIMMLGGSPTRVPMPPMFDSIASAIR